jgi:hypothetical protein
LPIIIVTAQDTTPKPNITNPKPIPELIQPSTNAIGAVKVIGVNIIPTVLGKRKTPTNPMPKIISNPGMKPPLNKVSPSPGPVQAVPR